MSLGLSSKLNILEESPLDQLPPSEPEPMEIEPELARWVASRFNIQTTTQDGSLIVWNSYKGSISVFPAEQRAKVRSLLTRRGVEARAEGLVGYLQKRGFLVKEGADEYRNFQHRFGRQHYRTDHLELMLLSSEDCNFRCEYCYEKFVRGTMQPWVRSSIKKFVESRVGGLRSLSIAWFGGEPLYGFEAVADLGPFFQRVAAEQKISFKSGITTNGYLLTPGAVDKLFDWKIRNFQVTIDGAPEDHDRLRHTRTGQGSFSKILENLKSLRARRDKFRMNIRVNFDPESQSRLEGFIELLGKEFGDDPRFRVLLRPVGRWGGSNDKNLEVCGVEEKDEVIAKLTEQTRKNGLGNFDDLRVTGRFGSLACYAARPNHFIIGADGKVMKCTVALDTKEANIVGRITADGELDMDEEKLAFWTEPVFTGNSKCQKCVILPVCQSLACPYEKLQGAEVACPPLRKNFKRRLIWTKRASEKNVKDVKVRCGTSADASFA